MVTYAIDEGNTDVTTLGVIKALITISNIACRTNSFVPVWRTIHPRSSSTMGERGLRPG